VIFMLYSHLYLYVSSFTAIVGINVNICLVVFVITCKHQSNTWQIYLFSKMVEIIWITSYTLL